MTVFIKDTILFKGTVYRNGKEITIEQAMHYIRGFEREKIHQELQSLCNKSKTERGLAKALGNYIDKLL